MPLKAIAEDTEHGFPEGVFDVRGWEVRTAEDDAQVGTVHGLLVDGEDRPRYLDIDLTRAEKHILLPIGQGRVDAADDVVWVPAVKRGEVEEVPAYGHDPGSITRDYEAELERRYSAAYAGDRFYARPEAEGSVGRRERPAVRRRSAERRTEPADRLSSLDAVEALRIAEGDPDPRGWEVVAADGRAVGGVDDLIVDTEALKVRYLACDLAEASPGTEERGRRILIPIGYARLDERERKVIVDALAATEMAQLPSYAGPPIQRAYEERLHAAFLDGFRGEDRYRHPRYSAERFAAPRRPER